MLIIMFITVLHGSLVIHVNSMNLNHLDLQNSQLLFEMVTNYGSDYQFKTITITE